MSEILDNIVNCSISIESPVEDGSSFGTLMVIGDAPPGGGNSLKNVDKYASLAEVMDAGWEEDSAVYKAARTAFLQDPKPEFIYIAVRQELAGADGPGGIKDEGTEEPDETEEPDDTEELGETEGTPEGRDMAVKVTEKFGGMENVLRFLGITAGTAIAAFQGKKILSFLKSFTGLLNTANLKIMAIAAVIVAIALIVDDFINFMQGNNSVIGDTLKKMGYDVDEVRDRIITAWNKVKGFLLQVWLSISQAAGAITAKLREFWEKNGEEIMERLSAIWNGLLTILKETWDVIRNLAVMRFSELKEFWDQWGEQILAAFSAVFFAAGEIFMAFLQVIQGIIDFIAGVFTGDWEKAWQGIQEIFTGVWNAVLAFLQGIWDAIYALFGEKIDAIVEKVRNFVEKIKGMLQGVKGFFGDIADSAGGFLSDVGNFVSGGTTVRAATVSNAGGTGGNKTNNINQDVKIENTFNGTDQKTMAAAATKAADDTTDQLAKGLKYGT